MHRSRQASTVTLEEAQAHLPELIERLGPGEELVITRDEKPVARLTGAGALSGPRPKLGTMRGSVRFMAPDFDAPLDDWPAQDRLRLLDETSEGLREEGDEPELTEELKAELDRRLASLDANPENAPTWEAIKESVRRPR